MLKEMLMQVGAAFCAWALLACMSYFVAVWCFASSMVWSSIIRWVGIIIGSLVVSLGVLYALEAQFADTITKIIIPSLVCLFAMHTLIVSIRTYLFQHSTLHVNKVRFYSTLAVLYAVFIAGVWGLILLKSMVLTQCITLTLQYFIYAAVVGIFILNMVNYHNDPEDRIH